MTPQDADLLVHDVIGRLFEEPEPLHRADLADGAIAHGMAATRRRGFAVAGATLSVLAVVAGAVPLADGGWGASGDWSLNPDSGADVSAQAYESATPNYADRQREILEQLPGVLGPLLPVGVTVGLRGIPVLGGPTDVDSGDFVPTISLHAGKATFTMEFSPVANGYAGGLAKAPAKTAVTGGSIRMAVVPYTGPGMTGFTAWYEFTPTDAGAQPVRFMVSGQSATTPIDAAAFARMVESRGFAQLRHLLDPAVQASAAAVRERYAIEAKINDEAVRVLPPGFRLKLNPAAPGGLELVGPGGVNTFGWYTLSASPDGNGCQPDTVCFASGDAALKNVGPDGRARLGKYVDWSKKSSGAFVMLQVFGIPQVGGSLANNDFVSLGKPGNETAPQGPGLTPQQARAIMTAPGVAKVIADVTRLAAVG